MTFRFQFMCILSILPKLSRLSLRHSHVVRDSLCIFSVKTSSLTVHSYQKWKPIFGNGRNGSMGRARMHYCERHSIESYLCTRYPFLFQSSQLHYVACNNWIKDGIGNSTQIKILITLPCHKSRIVGNCVLSRLFVITFHTTFSLRIFNKRNHWTCQPVKNVYPK